MKRQYAECPTCRERMKPTGIKDRVSKDINGKPLYEIEMECPSCGASWVFDERVKIFRHGRLLRST